jgi:hypothetical protein
MCHGISTSADLVLPVTVPVAVELRFVGDDGVEDAVGGGDREVVGGAMIAVEIDHDVDAIDLLVEIPLHALLGARHGRRLDGAKRHGQAFGRSENPDFGRQRRRLAVQRLDFAEFRDPPGVGPFLRIDATVDRDRRCLSDVCHEQARSQPQSSPLHHRSISCRFALSMPSRCHWLQCDSLDWAACRNDRSLRHESDLRRTSAAGDPRAGLYDHLRA